MAMLQDPSRKYRPFPQVPLPDRQWPSRTITAPPRWLSTDLRDGNQSIIDPMDAVKKNRFFDLLVEVGVKEIEVGFPSAGKTEFDFIQSLVRSDKIPEDVIVQVLTQSREDLIRTSFESLEGARAAIVHLYNADHRLVIAAEISRVDRQVGYAPQLVIALLLRSESLLDCVLMASGKGGKDQLAPIRMPLVNRDLVTIFDGLDDFVDV